MKIYFAPMEGITTYLYRNAFHRFYGGVDKYFTPFLSGPKLSRKEIREILPEHNAGISLVPQILTNRADVFLAVAEQLSSYGYTEVNLNLGCPSGTVVSKKRGAGFLDVPRELDRFLDEIYEKCPLAISVKTRLGISSLDEWLPLLSIFSKYPIRELIIHTRLQQEFYKGQTHPQAYWQARERLDIPLCYNGDITDAASYDSALRPDVVMLGRGLLSNPELALTLRGGSDPAENEVPHAKRDLLTFQEFHDEILEGYLSYMSGEQPVLFHMKELWTYMRHYLCLSDRQVKQIHKAKHLNEYQIIVRGLLIN